MTTQYRQGDVLLMRISRKRKPFGKRVAEKHLVLAQGEVTGHRHTMAGEVSLFETEKGPMVWVEAPTPLMHQEHDAILVAPGLYWVVRQREYHPEEIRRVSD